MQYLAASPCPVHFVYFFWFFERFLHVAIFVARVAYFFGRVPLDSFARFPPFLSCLFWRLGHNCQCPGAVPLAYTLFPLFAVFVAGLLLFFLLLQKNGIDMRVKISGSLPIGAFTYRVFVFPLAILSH